MVLWAIAILSLITGGIVYTIRQDLAISILQQERLVAHTLARAGVERAIALVMDDDPVVDSESDRWANDEINMKDVKLAGGTFTVLRDCYDDASVSRYGAGDESAKLNINVATREQLARLPRITPAVVAAIIDWRDDNEQPEPDGIERGYYESLPHPYTIRNAPMRTMREMLLVRGVTPELFYGEDTNVNGVLDDNENDGDASDPPDNADGRLDRGWYAWLTSYSFEKNVNPLSGQQRLNLSSADAGTLAQRLGLETWAAESIVKHREKNAFQHLVNLLDVERDSSVARDSSESDMNARSDEEKDHPVTQDIFRRIVDDLTLVDDQVLAGRVNLNTAPIEVLKALFEDNLADAIVRHREGGGLFNSIGDLLTIDGVTKDVFAGIENSVTIRSSVFRILSRGVSASGLATAGIECVVDRGTDVPRILYWLESSP